MTEGNHDRAWNDPPVFAYTGAPPKTENGNSSNPRRTMLNKRVAFPLSGGVQPSTPLSASGPPPIGTPPPLSVLLPVRHSSPESEISADKNEQALTENSTETSFDKVKRILEQKLIDANFQSPRQEEISKQIHKLLTSWEMGKINEDIQLRLVKLSDFLECGDFTSAENVQIALAVDYTSECSTWILALKNIIVELNESLKL